MLRGLHHPGDIQRAVPGDQQPCLGELLVHQIVKVILEPIVPVYLDNINAIIDQTLEVRGPIGILSGLSLMWSGSAAFNVIESGLGAIWGVSSRPFWRKRLLSMLSILVLGVAFIAAFFLAPILSWVSAAFDIPDNSLLDAILEVGLGLITTYVIYRVFPNKNVKRRTALIAAAISTFLIEIVKTVFTFYLGSAFANYGAVYGSLAWIVALAFWAYIVSQLFFLGAEIAVELRKREEI